MKRAPGLDKAGAPPAFVPSASRTLQLAAESRVIQLPPENTTLNGFTFGVSTFGLGEF